MRPLRSVPTFVSSPLDPLARWLDDHFAGGERDAAALRRRLRGFGCSSELRDLLQDLLTTPASLGALAARSYRHGNGFFKFELLARNGYKVRLHVWLPGLSAEENIHDHRWAFSSVILAGRLTSETYRDDAEGDLLCTEYAYTARQGEQAAHKELTGQTRLRRLERSTRRAGEAYSMAPEELHRICVDGRTLIATLMVSEPPLAGGSRLLVERGRDVDPDVAALPLDPVVARTTLRCVLDHLTTEKNR